MPREHHRPGSPKVNSAARISGQIEEMPEGTGKEIESIRRCRKGLLSTLRIRLKSFQQFRKLLSVTNFYFNTAEIQPTGEIRLSLYSGKSVKMAGTIDMKPSMLSSQLSKLCTANYKQTF